MVCWDLIQSYLGKLKHGKFTRIPQVERSDMFTFHQPHESLNLQSDIKAFSNLKKKKQQIRDGTEGQFEHGKFTLHNSS